MYFDYIPLGEKFENDEQKVIKWRIYAECRAPKSMLMTKEVINKRNIRSRSLNN